MIGILPREWRFCTLCMNEFDDSAKKIQIIAIMTPSLATMSIGRPIFFVSLNILVSM